MDLIEELNGEARIVVPRVEEGPPGLHLDDPTTYTVTVLL
jgi:hypothetical protein